MNEVACISSPGKGIERIAAVEEGWPVNKYSIKTIKNVNGEVFDCVDINKQPAFSHPLLKNHTIQMKPSIIPQGIAEPLTSKDLVSQVGRMVEKCPTGSIPIIRTPKKLSVAMKSVPDFMPEENLRVDSSTEGDSSVADIKMLKGEYYGSIAEVNVYGVPQVSSNQFSMSAMWVVNDGDGQKDIINSVLAGWMVNPGLFGDAQTRLFIYWTADGYQRTGCFNLRCSGFIQVNPAIPLGGVIYPVSTYNGTQYVIKILIFKDPNTGNWWMVMGENLDQYVGYWPKLIFTTLNGHANTMTWGGRVYTSKGEKSPPMGSGHWPYEGYGKACFYDRVRLVLKGNIYGEIKEDSILYYQSPCYGIGYFWKKKIGRYFNFGGPGGC